ncbi:MAG: helix-turn-helix transcriptional regulator [Deltaproteobacteria bacterium]|nr:helix-turn-helix transcriptional regulator [Deltaproteobacteria bacterium]
MKETRYRESRVCRVLGNPLAYGVIVKLLESGAQTPSQLASHIRRSVPTVSHTLSNLRLADLVRFDRSGRTALYRIKYPKEMRKLLNALEKFNDATRRVGK